MENTEWEQVSQAGLSAWLRWCQEGHTDLPSSKSAQHLRSSFIGNCSSPCGPCSGMVHESPSKEVQGQSLLCGPALVSLSLEWEPGQAWVGLVPRLNTLLSACPFSHTCYDVCDRASGRSSGHPGASYAWCSRLVPM